MFIRTLFFFLLSVLQVMGQQVKYASPLNIPLRLSGNFCEVRTDHFHSGIDIKTNGREGQPVFAVDDGYVSRVKISAVGYGKAIYITHSDHCVTVYGHLHSFMGALADSLESKQYARKSFEIEWFPDSSYFPVKRGQQIAWSGNSGGSESPHLHFEIRDEFTEEPLNPLLNGWTVNDTIAPIIQNVSIYNYSDGRYFFDNNYPVDKIESIGSNDTLFVNSDTVALSFVMNDEMNDSVSSSLGIYSVLLLNGTDSVYHYSFNRMNFNETRNVNGYIDYSKKENQKEIFLRCFALPGNRFSAFKNAGKGLIYIKQGETVHLKLLVSDANQNISKLELNFKGIAVDDSTLKGDSFIHYPNKKIIRRWNDVSVLIPEEAFFEAVPSIEMSGKSDRKTKLPVVRIGSKEIALKKQITIAYKPPAKHESKNEKLVIVELNKLGKIVKSIGGLYKDGLLTATTFSFGIYSVVVDDMPPQIQDWRIERDTIFHEHWLRLKVNDAVSGIKTYSGAISDEWKLFEYDPKSSTISYLLKKKYQLFKLNLEVTDNCGNTADYSAKIKVLLNDIITK